MTIPYDKPASAERARPALRVRVTPEALLYVALALLALATRLAALDAAPLNDAEARQALAALHLVRPTTPGAAPVADSPLTLLAQVIAFTFLPAGETAARLPVALGGVLLALTPALWRRYLGVLPALILSLLLTSSPVALLAARDSSPAVWTMLLALIIPWLALRFAETLREGWAVAATAGAGALIFLTEPAGALALAALALGVIFALLTEDDPDATSAAALRRVLAEWPWRAGLLAALGVVLVVGTGLFTLPSGATAVGNVLWSGLTGWAERPADQPVAFPLWIALRYEFGLLLFGALAAARALREGGFFERALAGWALAGLLASLVYAGAGAAHALWITLPLAVLVALAVTDWLTERAQAIWEPPAWGIALHALITFALWAAVGLSVVLLGKRLMSDLPAGITDLGELLRALVKGIYNRDMTQPQVVTLQNVSIFAYVLGYIQLRLLVTILVSLLNGVLFFLVGSLWGGRAAWRGFALGTLGALLLVSLGLGGGAAFERPADPRELWETAPTSPDLLRLRGTLREMSLRDTGEPYRMAITAQAADDGALAWALRDFENTVFVSGVGAEVGTAAVIVPLDQAGQRMGAAYVGRDYVLRRDWTPAWLTWQDALMWLYRSDARTPPQPAEPVRLWVRADVYGVEQVTED